jgi:uncharacterized delta-60 repeat protein
MYKKIKLLTATAVLSLLSACGGGGGGTPTSGVTQDTSNLTTLTGLQRVFPITSVNTNAFTSYLQTDGKLVLAGRNNGNCVIARFNSNKTADTTFNKTGLLFTTANATECEIKSVISQADGKIITLMLNKFAVYVNRFNVDGTIDTTFGTQGEFKTTYTTADKLFLDKDGKITVAVFIGDQLGITKLTSNGALDVSFGNNGISVSDSTPVRSSNIYVAPRKIARTAEEDFLIAFPTTSYYVQKILKNGTLDKTFGNYTAPHGGLPNMYWAEFEGLPAVGGSRLSYLTDIVPLVGGGFYVIGISSYNTYEKNYEIGITKGTAQGKIDTPFNATGKLLTGIRINSYQFAQVQADGKLVTASVNLGNPVVNRFNADGTLDNSFKNGQIGSSLGLQNLVDVHIQSDGKIVLVFQDYSFIKLLSTGVVE